MLSSARRTVAPWFGNETAFWKLFTWVLGTFALLKGLRLPNTWALTQAELDYRFGFIKRGLSGAVLHWFNLWHAREIRIAFGIELAILLALLVLLTKRSGLIKQEGGWYVTAAFASSYCLTYLTHAMGYAEIPEAALVVAVMLIRNVRARFVAAFPAVFIGILVHEEFLFIFTPLLVFSFFLDGTFEETTRIRVWICGTLVGVFAVVVTTGIAFRRSLAPDQVLRMQADIISRADFPVRTDSFVVLVLGLGSNVRIMWHMFTQSYWWWTEQVISICVFGPVLFILLRRCFRTLSSMGRATLLTRSAVLIAVFGPLAMHLVGFDQMRWNSMCVLDAYICLLLINMRKRGVSLPADGVERNSVMLVIALSMASGYGLMEGTPVNPYPYFPAAVKGFVAQHDEAKYPL